MSRESKGDPIDRLIAIMAHLRGPDGCPWDRQQTLETLKPYLVEETYEVLDAIDAGEPERLKNELGDVLLQVAFQSQIASEKDWFGFRDVAGAIADKLIRRHPHVFGDESVSTAAEVVETWERVKEKEGDRGLLDGVPRHMPALQKAYRVSQKVSRVGFDWPDVSGLLDKIAEEARELVEAEEERDIKAELGDVLFALCNLARHLRVDPEEALQEANDRFINRFSHVEKELTGRGASLQETPLEEMDRLWEEAKDIERKQR